MSSDSPGAPPSSRGKAPWVEAGSASEKARRKALPTSSAGLPRRGPSLRRAERCHPRSVRGGGPRVPELSLHGGARTRALPERSPLPAAPADPLDLNICL